MKQPRKIEVISLCIALAGILIALNFSNAMAQDDNSIIPLQRNSALPALKFSGTDQSFSQTFLFQFDDSVSLNVLSVVLEDPESPFTAVAMPCCSGLPMVAMPGDIIGVRITLNAGTPNIYHNRLKFILGGGDAPVIYDIEAIRTSPLAGVITATLESLNLSTSPNPSSGNVSVLVSGADHADIEIFNAIGALIASKNNVTSWAWNGETASGAKVPAGNYFVRAAAHDANGKIIVNTNHISIIK